MALPALVTAMLQPEFYPHRPADVALVQTHISYVFLAGNEVYKVKKPVRFPFLDFSTLDRRHHFCREEVRLNRRLAGDVYRGVVAIREDGGTFSMAAEDNAGAVDYAVHMRRLPDDRMLVGLLDRHAVTPAMIDAVVARMVEFHREADTNAAIAAAGDPAAIARRMEEEFATTAPFRGVTIAPADDDAIRSFCRETIARCDSLLRARQAAGRIRDCHGDLHAEHVCFTEPLVIFDCIEFNPNFRYGDVAAEIAFLAMDLDYHGAPELAAHFVSAYAAAAADPDLPRLVPFYQCYRAYVRGKVDSLKSAEPEVAAAEQKSARDSARRHFALAYRYTWAYTPRLVLLSGLSGTGKSTVAAALAARTGFAHINSDLVRKALFGIAPTDRVPPEQQAALYSPEHSARTYAAMTERAGAALAGGRGAILDATFQRREHRDAARAVARRLGLPCVLVALHCSESSVRQRLARRSAAGDSPSDADWQVYLSQRASYEAVTEDEDPSWLRLDTSTASIEEMSAAIERVLRTIGAK